MTNALKISVAANIALTASLAWFGQRLSRNDSRYRAAGSLSVAPSPARSSKPSTEESIQTRHVPFQWAQLESTDYRAYIANLRNIGCPERTIRDIITADIDSLYASRRKELARNQKTPRSPSAGLASTTRLQGREEALRTEEARVISILLGPQSPPAQVAPGIPEPRRGRRDPLEDATVSMPLVFQNVDPGAVKLDAQQLEVLDELRRGFQEEIGGSQLEPNDPAYRQLWQAAQRNNDDLLQGLLGGEFYLDYQLQAARWSAPQPPPP
jgi:hypothetical protein